MCSPMRKKRIKVPLKSVGAPKVKRFGTHFGKIGTACNTYVAAPFSADDA